MRRPRRCKPQDVTDLYRVLLGRDPESEDVIRGNEGRPWRDVLTDMLASDEFLHRTQGRVIARALQRAAHFDPTLVVTRSELEQEFSRVQAYWRGAGTDPASAYWSVLTADEWSGPLSQERLKAFYATGRGHVDLAVGLARRVRPGLDLREAHVLDFGCGVGRMLVHFIQGAKGAEGWDFSSGHLQLLEKNLSQLYGIPPARYDLRLIDSVDLDTSRSFDLIVSMLTLQHNPPALMAHTISQLIRCLGPRGVAVLHIPTAVVDEDLPPRQPVEPAMEMNAIPLESVFEIAADESASVRLARYVDWTSPRLLGQLMVIERDGPVNH